MLTVNGTTLNFAMNTNLNGFTVSHGGALFLTRAPLPVMVTGKSSVSGGSHVTINSQVHAQWWLTGSLTVGANSFIDFSRVNMSGGGTFVLDSPTAVADLGVADASIHATITQGTLQLEGPMTFSANPLGPNSYHGTVHEGAGGLVELLGNHPGVTHEIWNAKTDLLELTNTAGQPLDKIKFSGNSMIWAHFAQRGAMIDLTTAHVAGALPMLPAG